LKADPVILTEQVYLCRFWKVLGLESALSAV